MAETFEELADAAQAVLDAAALILGASAPPRRFISNGEPADDCPQMTVHLSSFAVQQNSNQGTAGAASHPRVVQYVATLRLRIIRCSPSPSDSGVAPSPAALAAHARDAYVDLYALYPQLRRMIQRGQLLGEDYCRGVAMGVATPVQDTGSVSGWIIDFQLDFEGPHGS